jgi:hypothetical protein
MVSKPTGVIGVNRSTHQLGLFKDTAIKLSVATRERGLDTAALDAAAADPLRAAKTNWDAADVIIGKLKYMARGAVPKPQNPVNKRTKSPAKVAPLASPVWSFVYAKNSGLGAEKERRAEPKLADGNADGATVQEFDEFPPMEWVDPEPPHKRYKFGRRKLLWELWRALRKARRRLTPDDLGEHVPTWKDKGLSGENVKQALSQLRNFWVGKDRSDLANRIDNAGGSVALR